MAGLELRSVGKTYPGGVKAVSDVNVSIADGEFIVLVGPSGCGKSTVLRMIAGLEQITEGDVDIGGARVNDVEPGDRDIAMVFQNYALYPHMSVYKNMAYGLKNQGMAKDEIAKRIAEAAKTLQLGDYLDRKPRQLSGGQRQRVAMGRAIVREPKVFLFDEPLSNLDAKLRTHMRSELKELHRRLGATFIFVTHDQVEAMSLADRIVIMNAGRIEQIGTPMELYNEPATQFVAEFIGAPPMNILPITSAAAAGLLKDQIPPAGAAHLGVRPEALRVLPEGTPGVAGNVTLTEALGAEIILHIRAAGMADTVTDRIIARQGQMAQASPGTRVSLTAEPGALTFFDEAGRSLHKKPAPVLTVL